MITVLDYYYKNGEYAGVKPYTLYTSAELDTLLNGNRNFELEVHAPRTKTVDYLKTDDAKDMLWFKSDDEPDIYVQWLDFDWQIETEALIPYKQITYIPGDSETGIYGDSFDIDMVVSRQKEWAELYLYMHNADEHFTGQLIKATPEELTEYIKETDMSYMPVEMW